MLHVLEIGITKPGQTIGNMLKYFMKRKILYFFIENYSYIFVFHVTVLCLRILGEIINSRKLESHRKALMRIRVI